ncbi:hypothetical protein OWM07_00715 [Deferribacter thermophilus]|uniref:TlpA family protein disulfide reductase n=1 Tax=Deferribacter thermophilus TaxID=53573 RepID=UPI003C27DFB9
MSRTNFLSGKNIIIYILVAYAFYYLYKYRQNEPPPYYSTIPNFEIKTINGKKFNLYDIKLKKVIVFLTTNNIYSNFYKKDIIKLKYIAEKKGWYFIVFVNTKQNKNDALKYISNKYYKGVEKDLYLTNIKKVEYIFGINSWPFMVILDENNRLIYASKVPNIKEINKIL